MAWRHVSEAQWGKIAAVHYDENLKTASNGPAWMKVVTVLAQGEHLLLPLPPPDPVCGDGMCNGSETAASCPVDCGIGGPDGPDW